jgi:UDP:flavonoid glycosyltransferase YjiC (YdhE family)
MKILVTSIGTRGDMEPFLAIGQIMKEKGHEVTCLFPEQFKPLVEESGFDFETLGSEFMEMIESDLGKVALGGSGSALKKFFAFIKLAKIQFRNNKLMIEKQFETITRLNPDRIIHNGKVLYPVVWEISNPNKTIYISPVPYLHYTKGHTHTAFHGNYGDFFNKLTYKLSDWGVRKAIMGMIKRLNLSNISKKQVQNAINTHKVIYAISPQLFERPDYWQKNMQVLGYHERNKTSNWQPDNELLNFLGKHSKILFVTFGSMTNPDPKEKTRIILDILKRNKIPAIINTSSGGLEKPDSYDAEQFHFVSHIPYDWIFQKMYAVIHHGGSGTTHLATKYGCASLIIPHIIDQFIWNKIVYEKGLGPKGIKIEKITIDNLEPKIISLLNDTKYKQNALKIADNMKSEEFFKKQLYDEIVGKKI